MSDDHYCRRCGKHFCVCEPERVSPAIPRYVADNITALAAQLAAMTARAESAERALLAAQADGAAMRAVLENVKATLYGVTDLGWNGVVRVKGIVDEALAANPGASVLAALAKCKAALTSARTWMRGGSMNDDTWKPMDGEFAAALALIAALGVA